MQSQPAILRPPPQSARYLAWTLRTGTDVRPVLDRLAKFDIGESTVIGLGAPLLRAAHTNLPALRPFPAVAGPGCAFPSTQGALWAHLGGADPGHTLHRARQLVALLGEAFTVDEDVLAFQHGGGRDLSGYEDGTENPTGDKAIATAIVANQGPALDGGSFVAAQRWIHNLTDFDRIPPHERDQVIGRHHDTNEEMEDAPVSAHVKRSAQESFSPESFMVRRSMPYGTVKEHGLYFVAYGATLDSFERVLTRMAGLEDGIPDALLRYTTPVSGGYYWCPPMDGNRLNLSLCRPQ